MRILFLSEAVSPHIFRWQEEFRRLGWETLVASCDHGEDFPGRRLNAGSSRGPLRYVSLVRQVEQVISEFQPHVINAHFLPTYGLTAALVNAHPLVLTLWGSDVFVSANKGVLRRLRSRFVLGRADLVVADAECLIAAAAAAGSIQRRLVVDFGVKRSWYESGLTRELQEIDIAQILSCRKFEKVYDVQTLIHAAKALADDDFPYHLTVAGSGSLESQLKGLVARLGLESHVTFVGYLKDEQLLSLYRKSDIYVSTCLSDSTSVSLLEAMSQKLYPVVTDIPGNREWLTSARFLFRAQDSRELADKIKLGFSREARENAYRECQATLLQKGIREDQMGIADLAFRKLIDEYPRK